MCGIAGLINQNLNREYLTKSIKAMQTAIAYRGNDNCGSWIEEKSGIALGHQRLSIVDIRNVGNQPMISNSGRYVINYNGEIYNHNELRKQLEKDNKYISWKSNCDTETLLESIDHWGIIETLNRSIGMFAISIYDKKEQKMFLIRDRYGEKPLYWGFSGYGSNRSLIFGSDISSIQAFPFFNNEISKNAISSFLKYSYISGQNSIYKGIEKLKAGGIIEIDLKIEIELKSLKIYTWWSLKENILTKKNSYYHSEEEALFKTESSLIASLKDQAFAEVPLTCFLSGGIDSSLIATLIINHVRKDLNTLSIGFDEKDYNESLKARKLSNFLGTNHTEIILTSEDAYSIIPKLPNIYSEPFADPAAIPTYLLCHSASTQNIKVALSGDGADELFAGYNRYTLGPKIWSIASKIPTNLRSRVLNSLNNIDISRWEKIGKLSKYSRFDERAKKIINRLLNVNSLDQLYEKLSQEWPESDIILNDYKSQSINNEEDFVLTDIDSLSKMMFQDCLRYLCDNNQVKIDRASMFVGIEARSPFLDQRVSESAWSISPLLRTKDGKGKYILKKILQRYLPNDFKDQPKAGFAVPIGIWMRDRLYKWSEELIQDEVSQKESIFDSQLLIRLWEEHQTENYDHSKKLWTILTWLSWKRENGKYIF